MKLAVAMVLAYGISLWMDWNNPFWAGFAVAFCGLGSTGESISKGLLRLCGTALGIVVALALLAIFPQDRWPFFIAMILWVAFCTYRLLGTPHWYFWFVAGFLVPLLTLSSGPVALNAFETVMLRAQQTTLGFLCFSLVWLFIWPSNTSAVFNNALHTLVDLQRQLFAHHDKVAAGGQDDGSTKALAQQAAPTRASLPGLLDGAAIDSLDVRESRQAWQRCVDLLGRLSDNLELWRQSLAAVDELHLQLYLPQAPAFSAELNRRFAAIAHLLAGEPPGLASAVLDLRLDASTTATLSHFQRAALIVCRDQMRELDRITAGLLETLTAIHRGEPIADARDYAPVHLPVLDLERLANVVRQATALGLACLAVIFVPDLPNAVTVVSLITSLSMMLSRTPQVRIAPIFAIIGYVTLAASVIYIVVLPQLTSFVGLSLVLFSTVFLIAYVFHQPQQGLVKAVGLALFVVLIDISNQQSYSFLYLANNAVAFPIIFVVLVIASFVPISFKPEHVFLRLLKRFFSSAAALSAMETLADNEHESLLQRLRKTYHRNLVATVPGQLAIWRRALPRSALGDTTPEQVQAAVTSLQLLTYRMRGVATARDHPQAEALMRELDDDLRGWRHGVQSIFRTMAAEPGRVERVDLRQRLDAHLERIEERVETALGKVGSNEVSTELGENMYRLLAVYRGVSEALLEVVGNATIIDWARLREPRF